MRIPTNVIGRPAAVIVAAAAVMGLAACASSPPTQFYSLSAVSTGSTAPDAGSSTAAHVRRVRVAAVHIPPSLDRREIVRQGAGDRLQINGERRWGAPFDEMVQHVLTADLVERLPRDAVVMPAGPSPSGTDSIVVDLLQFQSDADGAVVLQGSWSLMPSGQDNPALVRSFRYEESASAQDYGAQAAAMSRLLGRLADDIARESQAQH